MDIERTIIPDVLVIRPRKFGDHRGFLSEVFSNNVLQRHGVDLPWVQDNHSRSTSRGVLRGLHFQIAPSAQAKIVRVVHGAIFDVAVDLRRGSQTFGRHVAVELTAENWAQLYVPVGFAHGFCTLSAETDVLYKMSAPYAPASEGGVAWDDPDLAIDWPVKAADMILTDRDKAWPRLRDLGTPF